MRIAFLLVAYKEPRQVERLVKSLSEIGDFFIHIDKKTNENEFKKRLAGCKNVKFIEKRVRVNWAGWSVVCANMRLLEMAYLSEVAYDRFVMLTGQDYPIMSNSQIVKEFESHPDTEYIMAYKITTSSIETDKDKIKKVWYFDNPFNCIFLRRVWASFMYRIFTVHSNRRKVTVPLRGQEVDAYFGQMLSAFTRNGARKLVNIFQYDYAYNKVMRHVHAPDEIYWHTVIFNSDLRKNTIQNGEEHEITRQFGWAPLHYHTYLDYCSVFTEENFDELKNCGYMFCRKVVPGISDGLMDKIDEMRAGK